MDELEAYRTGGRIISKLHRFIPGLVHEGFPIRELCERVEAETIALGGQPAFPCNVGINEVAAHYTPTWNDTATLPKGAVVKVDFGVHIDGYINDSALTVSLNPVYDPMIEAAKEALRRGVGIVSSGVKFADVGKQIEKTIMQYGCKPIRNLSGHKIERYTIHAKVSVPNVAGPAPGRFEVGEVYAIEPFVTTREAAGKVEHSEQAFIYRMVRNRGVQSESAKRIIEYAQRTYRTLPFAPRWIYSALGKTIFEKGFPEAVSTRCILGYPVLIEASGNVVTQAEHTLIVRKNGCEVLTA